VIINEDDYLAHYGTPRHSGRYPWGSGGNVEGGQKENPTKRNKSFLDTVADLKKQGLSEAEIAKGMGLDSTTRLRAKKTLALNAEKQYQIATAERLKAKGMANTEAAKQMGIPESTFRSLLAPGARERAQILTNTAEMLKKEVDAKTYVDIGTAVENRINVSKEKLDVAVAMLEEQGYMKHPLNIPQPGTGFDTRMKILAPPGTTQRMVWENRDKIQQLTSVSEDGGLSFSSGKIHDPIAVNPNRVEVRYKGEGGEKADGVIYVRPGVEDISLGKARYAQVRVQVGEGHYLKGMAMYKDDLPPGKDIVFNTNKSSTGNKLDAMKPLKADTDLPFGAVVSQIKADINTPRERVTSAMNIVTEEGQWGEWSKNLSSQFLSKQNISLAKEQLNKTYVRRKQEFDEINSLTNPAVKKKLLKSFSDDADSASVHLKSATLSRRDAWHAILPIESLPATQVYAPNYNHGEHVALVRYPHGGTFEIPQLIVNNNHPESKRLLGGARDAIGINHKVAERLSGADFDGDTVIVLPNPRGKVRSTPALEGLKNFDPRSEFKAYEGMPRITEDRKQNEMGKISNLITDMTLKGAPQEQLVRAIKHSMVVIDAEKHHLDYKRSAQVNAIAALKEEYQGGKSAGAKTLIARKKKELRIPHRVERPQPLGGSINPVTGRKEFVPSGRTRKTSTGRVPLMIWVKELAEIQDAHQLSSGTPMENLYADHSNRLKALANQARLAELNTPTLKYSSSAKKVYAKEVASLDAKLNIANQNRPLERQSLVIANANTRARKQANPDLDKDSIKKIEFQELERARARMGANKKLRRVEITPKEWDAIQAGAISNNKLEQILSNTDIEAIRKYATPRKTVLMTSRNVARAKSLLASGKTRAEVAAILGVSVTTLDVGVSGEEG
jgi:predicted DNA-binding protein (UPF0251 family)